QRRRDDLARQLDDLPAEPRARREGHRSGDSHRHQAREDLPGQSLTAPQGMLREVAVIEAARSEAAKTATLPPSPKVAAPVRMVLATSMSLMWYWASRSAGRPSAMPPECRPSTRMPCWPSSAANWRRRKSTEFKAPWSPPIE